MIIYNKINVKNMLSDINCKILLIINHIEFDQQLINQLKEIQMISEMNNGEDYQAQFAPNNTIYLSNLNEKVPIQELKDTLFNMFQEYGEIIDIVAKKNIRMRGQAFVIFKDINSAMQAKRKNNSKELYGKTMKIHFAKEKSDVVAKIEGTFVIRERPDDYFQQKFQEKFVQRPQQIKAKAEREKNVVRKIDKSHNAPNHILFCEGLTPSITTEILTSYFIKYPGLVDVRLAPKNYAFIEYADEFKAGTALAALNGLQIGDSVLHISYAKK